MSDLTIDLSHMHGPNLFEAKGDKWVLQRFLVEWLDKNAPGWSFDQQYKAAGKLTFETEAHLRAFRLKKMWTQPQPTISQVLGQNTAADPAARSGDPYHFLLVAAEEFRQQADLGNGWFSSPPTIIEGKLRRLHEKLHGMVDL